MAAASSSDRRTENMRKLSKSWHDQIEPKRIRVTDEDIGDTMTVGGLDTVNDDVVFEEWQTWLDDWNDVDDETANNIEGIRNGKMDELLSMGKWKLHEVVPTSQTIGKRVIPAKWVVQQRADEWRCRWVACDRRDLSPGANDGFFTPGSHPTTARLVDVIAVKSMRPTRIADADHAYWQVEEEDEVYCTAPFELKQQRAAAGLSIDIMLRLKKKLYGKRDASMEFNELVAGHILSLGFEQCVDQPAFFVHHEREYVIELHQDDFHECAPEEDLNWFRGEMTSKVELKWSQLLWPGHRYSFLKCERVRTSTGAWILGNQKHTDEIVSLLELKDAKTAPTPITCTREIEELELPEIDDARKTIYRTCVGLARYQLKHRGAENLAVKELSHGLSLTTEADWNRLKRFGRYLKGKRKHAVFLPAEGDITELVIDCDSDWAGDKVSRKSVSSMCAFVGNAPVYDEAVSKKVVGASSGEVEWYAACGAAAHGLHLEKCVEFPNQQAREISHSHRQQRLQGYRC